MEFLSLDSPGGVKFSSAKKIPHPMKIRLSTLVPQENIENNFRTPLRVLHYIKNVKFNKF